MKRIASALALAMAPCLALGADAGAPGCKSTAECAEQAARIGAFVPTPVSKGNTTSPLDLAEDQFYWMNKINKASIVMLVEEKILPPESGRTIARGIAQTLDQAARPGGKRPSDVMQIEKIITDSIGPEGSLIHAGRSRQDMYATFRAAQLRNQVLDFSDAINSLRDRMLVTASKHVNTIVPAYTNGVQAQPVSYAHYLLAFEASFARDAQRIRELHARLNRSAMGTAVLANSGWPLNRKRLADLLGFDGLIENSYDAGQVFTYDVPIEASGIASSHAIRLGAILGDIHTQYHQTRPWLLLEEGATYSSSAMPQKRNPGLVMNAREAASTVVGLAHTVSLRAHNVTPGMRDYKQTPVDLALFPQAVRMIAAMNAVMDSLVVNPKRALEELEDDWTTSIDIAETLQRDHGVPFRVGHSFASSLVTYARTEGLRPREFPYPKAVESYKEALAKYKLPDAKLPLDEKAFRKLLSPADMVRTRVGIGGPQPAEVERMLAGAQATLKADKSWMLGTRGKLKEADAKLDAAFGKLSGT
ncbi:MAG: argininosuccinate lyase [Betaproteobacteria bacterium]|nr:argininosuccinate lyase [Betaproteobacteria bacterium]